VALLGSVAVANVADCAGVSQQLAIDSPALTLVKTVKNGALYTTPLADSNVTFRVAHVYGTPYEMGQAHGELLAEEINQLLDEMWTWLEQTVDTYLHELPEWLQNFIAEAGIDAALEFERLATDLYTSEDYKEELKGMAAGSGADHGRLIGVNMIPELVKAHCTLIGAWGKATAETNNGSLVQVRALDWAVGQAVPLQNFPLLIVFHPAEGYGQSFMSLGWPSFVGSLVGFNGKLGMGEKVWLHYDGKSSRFGEPWNYVLRDVLQYETTVPGALQRLEDSKRTCSIFLGVGAAESNPPYTLCEYSYESVVHYNDTDFQPTNANHPQYEGVVYVDKHTQPTSHQCVGELIKESYGSLSAPTFIRDVLSAEQSGNLLAVVMDFGAQDFYCSVGTAEENAYNRPWMKFDAASLLSRTQ